MNKLTFAACNLVIALVCATLAGCVKDDSHMTPHSSNGAVRVDAGESVPGSNPAVVTIIDSEGREIEVPENEPIILAPGTYEAVTHTPADGVAVSGAVVTINPAESDWAEAGPFINGQPGLIQTGVKTVVVEADKEYEVVTPLVQQVRKLMLVLNPTGDAAPKISAIRAFLTGVAGAMNVQTGAYSSPSCVELQFAPAGDGLWTASVWLLGVVEAETRASYMGLSQQMIVGSMEFADNNPLPLRFERDLTGELADFNSSKVIPLTIDEQRVPTYSLAQPASDIADWRPLDGGTTVAD